MIRMPKIDYDVVEMAGGLDLLTPTLSLKAGVCRDAVNFECATTGGYTRISGYERYDGQAAPSAGLASLLQVVSFTNVPTVGQTLTGMTSGATAYICAVATNYLVLTQVVGSFTTSEVCKVGATVIGTSTSFTATVTAKQNAQYTALAADVYRALIAKVPGSGPIRGVTGYQIAGVDYVYAFRDNVGGTSTDIYQASGASWVKIPYKYEMSFTIGSVSKPVEGELMTDASSGATAIIRRVMDTSGSWAATTAAGRLVIDAPAGGNFTHNALTLPSGAVLTPTGAATLIANTPGGQVEFFTGNLTGSSKTKRLYGADGVNRGFEFDGVTYAPIVTGNSPDNPKHVVVHRNHLMLSIGSSFFFSGPGTPFRWLAADNGGEIATGDNVTGFLIQPGAQPTAALAVYGQENTFMLYGTDPTGTGAWNFVPYNTGTGAFAYTLQNMAQSYVLDDPGVIAMQPTLAYGNFTQTAITANIRPFIIAERTAASASSLKREKSQYRVFFNDGYGLYLTIVNGKMMGSMPVHFPDPVLVAWEGMSSTGDGISYFGSNSGYVFQLDQGSSFDGGNIDAYITLNWNSMRSPRVLKRMRHASLEIQGDHYTEVQFGYKLGYGTGELTQPSLATYASGFAPAPAWDTFVWDNFTWDGLTLAPTEVGLVGTAENMQVTISSTGNYIYPFTVNSQITHFTPRRGLR